MLLLVEVDGCEEELDAKDNEENGITGWDFGV